MREVAGRLRHPGSDALDLHHCYRAMAWLGEELPGEAAQQHATSLAPRTVQDQIEEALFVRRRDLSVVIEAQGRPICSEPRPGNTAATGWSARWSWRTIARSRLSRLRKNPLVSSSLA